MKHGVHLPNFGGLGNARLLAELAKAAEAAGWDGFFLWDHLLFCELDKMAHADPWVSLTAAAMLTERIMLGTLVTPIPRRRPWKLARETASLQNLSGGRLILGVGLGDPVEWEYRFFHEEDDAKIRAAKLDEGLAILKGLWTGESFGFEGQHYQLKEMTFLPKPVQPIPVWVGGYWPRKSPMRRAAGHEGVVPGVVDEGALSPELVKDILAYIQSQRQSDAAYDMVVSGRSEAGADAYAQLVQPMEAAGASWWIEDISPLRLEGIDWYNLWKPWDIAPLRARIEAGPPRP